MVDQDIVPTNSPESGADIVNLRELADLLGLSENSVRDLIRRNPDFPIAARGAHGVAYEFDAAAVADWWAAHQSQAEAAKDARRAELAQIRLELFPGADDDPALAGLSPHERKAEIEAQIRQDQLRRARGDLLQRTEVEQVLARTFAELSKRLKAIPADLARQHDLARPLRRDLEAGIRKHVNAAVDALQDLLAAETEAAETEPEPGEGG